MCMHTQLIAEKTKYALGKGLGVILCIGESLEQREAGDTFKVGERNPSIQPPGLMKTRLMQRQEHHQGHQARESKP